MTDQGEDVADSDPRLHPVLCRKTLVSDRRRREKCPNSSKSSSDLGRCRQFCLTRLYWATMGLERRDRFHLPTTCYSRVKSSFRLFRRNSGIWFWENRQTGHQGSFCTRDKTEAKRLLNAKNEAQEIPALNIEMAKVYLNAADPTLSKRTWRYTVEQLMLAATGKCSKTANLNLRLAKRESRNGF